MTFEESLDVLLEERIKFHIDTLIDETLDSNQVHFERGKVSALKWVKESIPDVIEMAKPLENTNWLINRTLPE